MGARYRCAEVEPPRPRHRLHDRVAAVTRIDVMTDGGGGYCMGGPREGLAHAHRSVGGGELVLNRRLRLPGSCELLPHGDEARAVVG